MMDGHRKRDDPDEALNFRGTHSFDLPQELPRFSCAGNIVVPKTQGATQMDREQELKKLAQLEKEVADLKAMLEKPQRTPSLLMRPAEDLDVYWEIHSGAATGRLHAVDCEGIQRGVHGNCFQSESLAKAYAEAIDTMLLLRHQPGTRKGSGSAMWCIGTTATGHLTIFRSNVDCTGLICPAFDNAESARAAIAVIGIARILRMFKVLHHVDN
ncbi:MAG: hypothetical protein ACRC8G_10000 [Plesiomonas shigelloides]